MEKGKYEYKDSSHFIAHSVIHGPVHFSSVPFNQAAYLKRILNDKDNITTDLRYVDISSHENINFEIDNIGIEVLDSPDLKLSGLLNNYSYWDNESDDEPEIPESEPTEEKKITQRVDKILTIASDTQRFVLVGAPGSGKTTTLRKVLHERARQILELSQNNKLPVFIAAKNYSKINGNDFETLISRALGTDIGNTIQLLNSGNLHILIDGVNEIDSDQRYGAFDEINKLMDYYLDCAFIISSRKYGFQNKFKIKEFELKEFQEPEIREFLFKHNPEKAETIWQELESNKKILALASNPLMLFMIFAVSFKTGKIPKNKGVLFDFFIKGILENEYTKTSETRKFHYEHVESYLLERLDVLALFSFSMKKEGKVSIEKERLKNIIHKEHDYDVFFELLNSPLFVEDGDNISFYHETFLDYFAALHIKQQFLSRLDGALSLEDLGITDITATQWYEPLILCSDLLSIKGAKERHAFLFFELLYKGAINQKRQQHSFAVKEIAYSNGAYRLTVTKPSLLALKSGIREDLTIPCKIAFNLKSRFPNVYKTAEQYLKNHMQLWYLLNENFKNQLSYNKFFAAVGALSSPELMQHILYYLDWQELWLYGQKYKTEVIEAFVKNISDFEMCLELLNNKDLRKNVLWEDINKKMDILGNQLFSSITTNELKRYYLKNPKNQQLLEFIGGIDLDFFIENFDFANWELNDFINALKNNLRSPRARFTLVELLQKPELDDSEKISIYKLFLRGPYYKEIIAHINADILNSSPSYSSVVDLLRLLPFEELSASIQDYFRNYKIINEDILVGYTVSKVKDKKIGLLVENLMLTSNSDILYYQNVLIANKYYEVLSITFSRTNNFGNSISISNINQFPVTLNALFYISHNDDIDTITNNSSMSFTNYYGNLTHPYLLNNDSNFISLLDKYNNQERYNIVRKIGWLHKYHMSLPQVKYYLFIAKYGNYYTVYGLQDGQTIHHYSEDENSAFLFNIAVKEENGLLVFIEDQINRDKKIGYTESQIIRLDPGRKEGHIALKKRDNNGDNDVKDYYFVYNDCNFRPKLGDYVSFLPAINTRLSAKGLPKAYKIEKLKEVDTCRIKTVALFQSKELCYHGYAEDLTTSEELYFRLPVGMQGKIKNYEGLITAGMICKYLTVYDAPADERKKRINIVSIQVDICRIARLFGTEENAAYYSGIAFDVKTKEKLFFRINKPDVPALPNYEGSFTAGKLCKYAVLADETNEKSKLVALTSIVVNRPKKNSEDIAEPLDH